MAKEKKQDFSFGVIPFREHNDRREFLLIKVKQKRDYWCFPKGHKEHGETELEAAIRELKEETGIVGVYIFENKLFTESYTFRFEDTYINKQVSYYLGRVDIDGQVLIQKEEVSDYKWCGFDEALELLTFPDAQRIIKESNEFLSHQTGEIIMD